MINHRYQYPIIPVTGQVLSSGHFGDLKTKFGSHSIGLYDTSTWSIATGSGNGKTFFIGYSSEATKDSLDRWHFGRTDGKKSEEFRGKDIISFEYSLPKRSQKETWTVGFDGSWSTDATKANDLPYNFECGKVYGLQLNLSGSPTWRRWAKNVVHQIFVTTPCCDSADCTVGCPSNVVDNETVYRLFAEQINAHPELSLLGVKARFRTDGWTSTPPTHYDYTLTIADGGTPYNLSAVQDQTNAALSATYGPITVVRTDYTDGKSTYKVSCLIAAAGTTLVNDTFNPPTYVPLAACNGTCPTGYTLTAGLDNYTLVRALSGGETLSTAADKQAFAYAATDAYRYSLTAYTSVISSGEFTANAHKFVTGQAVFYNNGGGNTITNLTNNTTYYIIKTGTNTFKLANSLANALAGTALTSTAAVAGATQNLIPVYRATATASLTVSGLTTPSITFSANHGYETGDTLFVTAIGNLATITANTIYYVTKVSATVIKLSTSAANMLAGTFATVTGTATGTWTAIPINNPATFDSSTPSNAFITFKQSNGMAAPTQIGSDIIITGATNGATCVITSAPTTVAWVQGTGYYKTTRTLTMRLPRKDCVGLYNGGNWLTELNALYAPMVTSGELHSDGVTLVTFAPPNEDTITEVGGCTDIYNIKQYSYCLTDGCLAKDPSSYPPIPQGFLGANGISGVWEVVGANTWQSPGSLDANGFQEKLAGIEITAEVTERYLSDCSMDINDFYETEPIRMEVSWVVNQMTGLPATCNTTSKMPAAKRQQAGLYQRQSGEWLMREYLKAGAYDFTAVDDSSARMREILDQNRRQQIDRKAFYKLYYITYKSNKGHTSNFDEKAEVWETMIAFREDDPKAATFESQFGAVFSKFDVVLKERK